MCASVNYFVSPFSCSLSLYLHPFTPSLPPSLPPYLTVSLPPYLTVSLSLPSPPSLSHCLSLSLSHCLSLSLSHCLSPPFPPYTSVTLPPPPVCLSSCYLPFSHHPFIPHLNFFFPSFPIFSLSLSVQPLCLSPCLSLPPSLSSSKSHKTILQNHTLTLHTLRNSQTPRPLRSLCQHSCSSLAPLMSLSRPPHFYPHLLIHVL